MIPNDRARAQKFIVFMRIEKKKYLSEIYEVQAFYITLQNRLKPHEHEY